MNECKPLPGIIAGTVPIIRLSMRSGSAARLSYDAVRSENSGGGASTAAGSPTDTPAVDSASAQGLTLVRFSAQCKHVLWDRGCIKGLFMGCLGGVRGYERVRRM